MAWGAPPIIVETAMTLTHAIANQDIKTIIFILCSLGLLLLLVRPRKK